MKKTYLIIIISLLIIVIAGYLFLRFSVLKHSKIPEKTSKAETIIDLRPALIAKLQELVKNTSNGLYNLHIGQISPDVLNSKIDISDVALEPDSAVLKKLNLEHNAPDDVFKITFRLLHIDGVEVKELLFNKKLDLKTINVDDPVIKIYQTKKSYNEAKRQASDSTTFYQKIMKQFNRVSVANIVVKKGTLSLTDVQQKSTLLFNDVSFDMNDILIDSTTQYDKSRFLYSKRAKIGSRDYVFKTADSLYLIKCGSINISTDTRTLTAKDLELVPRLSRQDFQKKLKYGKDMYTVKVPKLVLSGGDWWKLVNKENFIADRADIYNASCNVYLNTALPDAPITNLRNFPSQQIMELKSPVFISKLNLYSSDVIYQEYEPEISQTGTISFNDIKASVENITNIKKHIKKIGSTTIKGFALFRKKVPMNVALSFDLTKVKTGNYTADLSSGSLDTSIINPFAKPMGLFELKSGVVQNATVHIDGNNTFSKGKIKLLYTDLKVVPLKKNRNNKGELKKKNLLGAIVNIFFIKNSNPDKSGKIRTVDYSVQRGKSNAFSEMTWKIILTGILKTIGAPAKIAN